jgi:HPt (histidine-containing phosphotransfer) domain-containing protein
MLARQLEQAKNMARTEVETLLRLVDSDFDSLRRFIDRTAGALGEINERMSRPQNDARERLHPLDFILRAVHGIKGEAAAQSASALASSTLLTRPAPALTSAMQSIRSPNVITE